MRWVLIRDPKGRAEPQSLLSTDPALEATPIVNTFVRRWAMEVTFQKTRAHLGIEGQRHHPAISEERSRIGILVT